MGDSVGARAKDNHALAGHIDQMLGIAAGQIADRFEGRAGFCRTDLLEAPEQLAFGAGLKPVADQELIDSVSALRVGRLARGGDR